MRCGGCGAKVGATVLSRVMKRLEPIPTNKNVEVGIDQPDDAAVVSVLPGMVGVQTVDYFRAFVDDPYMFGQIAAVHALGDCWAMGADPHAALAIATVPYGLETQVEETLYQMMAGACSILRDAGCGLAGGHSSEGAELSLGFSVRRSPREKLMKKGGMKAGHKIILTKPVGTGTLFAADMRSKAQGRWISNALNSMRQPSAVAAKTLFDHGATSCTDVTGFGLLGHLVEMCKEATPPPPWTPYPSFRARWSAWNRASQALCNRPTSDSRERWRIHPPCPGRQSIRSSSILKPPAAC